MQLEVLEQSLTVIQSGAMRIIESAEIKLIEIERAEQALAIPQVEHQAEIRQIWEIETNDPATQEWRSMLEPERSCQRLSSLWLRYRHCPLTDSD